MEYNFLVYETRGIKLSVSRLSSPFTDEETSKLRKNARERAHSIRDLLIIIFIKFVLSENGQIREKN